MKKKNCIKTSNKVFSGVNIINKEKKQYLLNWKKYNEIKQNKKTNQNKTKAKAKTKQNKKFMLAKKTCQFLFWSVIPPEKYMYNTYLVRLLFRNWNVCHGHLVPYSLSLLKKYDKIRFFYNVSTECWEHRLHVKILLLL